MEKITEKWFKDRGWKRYEEKTKMYEDQPGCENTTRHSIQYYLVSKDIHARWDCVVYVTPAGRHNKKKVVRFYMFWAKGKNGFQVENRISHRRFNVDQIVSALGVIGYKEDKTKLCQAEE